MIDVDVDFGGEGSRVGYKSRGYVKVKAKDILIFN